MKQRQSCTFLTQVSPAQVLKSCRCLSQMVSLSHLIHFSPVMMQRQSCQGSSHLFQVSQIRQRQSCTFLIHFSPLMLQRQSCQGSSHLFQVSLMKQRQSCTFLIQVSPLMMQRMSCQGSSHSFQGSQMKQRQSCTNMITFPRPTIPYPCLQCLAITCPMIQRPMIHVLHAYPSPQMIISHLVTPQMTMHRQRPKEATEGRERRRRNLPT